MNDHAAMPEDAGAQLPLAGLKVIEFCHLIMGPTAGLLLSELGAEVIKVEPLPEGDRTRSIKGHIAGAFSYYNRNKKSIGIDIKSEEGQSIIDKLVEQADVVTENFAPGTAERIGIGYERLSKLNPKLIYCSLKGFLPGPYEKRAGLDELAQFMTGLAYMTGPLNQPLRAGSSLIDIGGGMFGVIGILAALQQRNRTGKGQKIQSALYETSAFFVGQHMAGEAFTGTKSLPYPVRKRSWAIYEIFMTKDDKELFVGITSDKQWAGFCREFDRPDLMRPEWKTNEQRRDNRNDVQPLVAALFSQFTADELIERLTPLGCPVGIAAKPGDLFDDPQLNFEGRMSETQLLDGQTVRLPRLPLLMDGVKPTARPSGAVSDFGQDTDDVLASLGYDSATREKLRQQGAVL